MVDTNILMFFQYLHQYRQPVNRPAKIKEEIKLTNIQLLDKTPVVGKPLRFEAVFPDGVCRIVTTSKIVNWWQGYPYGPQDIRIETMNRVYFGNCDRPLS